MEIVKIILGVVLWVLALLFIYNLVRRVTGGFGPQGGGWRGNVAALVISALLILGGIRLIF